MTYLIIFFVIVVIAWVLLALTFKDEGTNSGSRLRGFLLLGPFYPFVSKYSKTRNGDISNRERLGLFFLLVFFAIVSIWLIAKQ